jgi:hypothetical protein
VGPLIHCCRRVYLAESEVLVREHSRLAGFPITRVNAHGHRPDDCKRLSATREAALKELVGTNRWFFAAALTASKAPIRCPITGYPCEGDISHLCEDYGCARKGGLSPCSDENL